MDIIWLDNNNILNMVFGAHEYQERHIFHLLKKNTLMSSSKRPLCDLHQVCLCASSRDDVTMIPFICMGGYSFKNMHINLTFKDKS
jgi:hypothetical protein